jgi:hypothetical protein
MRTALSTVCSLDSSLETILEDYAAGHCDAIDLWLGHAETYLENHSPGDLKGLFAAHGITPVAASFQGGLLTSQGEARQAHWRHFEIRLGLLRELAIPVLVVAGDAFGPLGPEDLSRLSLSLTEAATRAADAGVRLALEFDARASFPNNLQSAVALVEDVGHPSLGICLDWFHFSVGPSKPLDLYLLSPETSRTCNSPIRPTCPAKWRPTPTASCPVRVPRPPTNSSDGLARSATPAPSASNCRIRDCGGCRRVSLARSRSHRSARSSARRRCDHWLRTTVRGCPCPVAGRSLRHPASAHSMAAALSASCLRLPPTPALGAWPAPHGCIGFHKSPRRKPGDSGDDHRPTCHADPGTPNNRCPRTSDRGFLTPGPPHPISGNRAACWRGPRSRRSAAVSTVCRLAGCRNDGRR